jgi:hypothetical protein
MRAMSSGCPKRPSGVSATVFLLKVAAHNAATARPFGANDARCNGVDAYFSRT